MNIKEIIGKPFIVTLLLLATGATGLAAPAPAAKLERLNERIERTRKAGEQMTRLNYNTFMRGGDFHILETFVGMNADEAGVPEELLGETVLFEFAYLIRTMKGHPETDELGKIMLAVLTESIDPATARARVREVADRYLARHSDEQKWYFELGRRTTSLMMASYLGEQERVMKDLSEMGRLLAEAPPKLPRSIAGELGRIVGYASKPVLTEEELYALDEHLAELQLRFDEA